VAAPLTWVGTWHRGFVPNLSWDALEALRLALVTDDPALVQGATALGSAPGDVLSWRRAWPCKAACAAGLCGWKGEGLLDREEVNSYFARLCCAVDLCLGMQGAAMVFIRWFDRTPRKAMRRELLREVVKALVERGEKSLAPVAA
jgi:hypothetical protein